MTKREASNPDFTVIGNWKMHKSAPEVEQFLEMIRPVFSKFTVRCGLAVPFTSIQKAKEVALRDFARGGTYDLLIGAQNMNEASEGAFTGEIAAKMLKSVGAQFVILGHSERRRYFHEDNACIQRKVHRAISEDLPFILCIGETLAEREAGETLHVLRQQLGALLETVSDEKLALCTIAYEPVWAIGTGVTASLKQIEQTLGEVRTILDDRYAEGGKTIPLLYGGSVTTKNCKELSLCANVNGFLVGGASLDPQHFIEICRVKS